MSNAYKMVDFDNRGDRELVGAGSVSYLWTFLLKFAEAKSVV